MKILLLVLILTAVTFAQVVYRFDKDKTNQLIVECGQELSIKSEDIDLIVNGTVGSQQLPKCLLKCMIRKMGFIDENGKVQLDNYHDIIPKDDPIRESMVKCQHIVVETCDDPLKLMRCSDEALKSKRRI